MTNLQVLLSLALGSIVSVILYLYLDTYIWKKSLKKDLEKWHDHEKR